MLIRFTEEELLNKLNLLHSENYSTLQNALEHVEEDIEGRLSLVLDGLGIDNSRKTDRKSLPVQEQVRRSKPFVSYFNDMLQIKILKREMVRELLVRGQAKVRYFVDIQPVYDNAGKIKMLDYSINWYEHNLV